MKFAYRLAAAAVCVACALPAAEAAAAVRVFPGCGVTLAACMKSSPGGTTIRLRTNGLVRIPDLELKKALSLEPAPGFRPTIGPTGVHARIELAPTGKRTTVSIRGIVFQQVAVSVQLVSGSGHKVVFERNRLTNDSGVNGDRGIAVYHSGSARGSVSVRDNRISSAGTGIEAQIQGGPATITGNTVTAPVHGDSQGGITVYSRATGKVRTTIASNVVHDVAGCNCGTPAGIQARALDSTKLDLRILGNTIDAVGIDALHQGSAINVVVSSSSDPDARIEAALYNNLATDQKSYGIILGGAPELQAAGARNAVTGAPNGNVLGPHDIGTILTDAPLYVDAPGGNYRLGPGSPYANAGQTCIASMPLPRGDAARKFRVAHGSVDIGAYERGSRVSAGVKGRNASGTNGPNRIVGTGGRDVLCGLGGPDRLGGRGGADLLIGGKGSDRASGGAGNDRIDTRDGVGGNDRALGGPGNDTCLTDAGDVRRSC